MRRGRLVRHYSTSSFRPDGKISATDFYNADGSIGHSVCLYDDAGRLTESNSSMGDGPVSRALYFYDEAGRHLRTAHLSQDGPQTDTEICIYDAGGKRTKVQFLTFTGAPPTPATVLKAQTWDGLLLEPRG